MIIYAVDVHYLIHTCPADPEPHPVDTRQQVVHVTPGGPCRTPVTVRCGDTATVIPCGRRKPVKRQCHACRTTVTVHRATTRRLNAQPVHVAPATTGHAPLRCDVCRQPLAAVLAAWGHHVLCHPRPAHHRGAA